MKDDQYEKMDKARLAADERRHKRELAAKDKMHKRETFWKSYDHSDAMGLVMLVGGIGFIGSVCYTLIMFARHTWP